MAEKACLVCGNLFQYWGHAKYCDACQRIGERRTTHLRQGRTDISYSGYILRRCRACGKVLELRKQGQIYCSLKCRFGPPALCACGCGATIPGYAVKNSGTRYKQGHHWRGRKHTAEQKLKIGIVNKGSSNPNWRGGTSYAGYPWEFVEMRPHIIERDGSRCVLCRNGKTRLHVHHIDGNTRNNNETNLITLCCRCHGKVGRTEKSRKSWVHRLITIAEQHSTATKGGDTWPLRECRA